MGLLSDLGLGAARALRTRLGARGALRVLTPMILGAEPSPARAAATLVALECAAELSDARAVDALAQAWSLEGVGARTADVAQGCAVLAARSPSAALSLADANVTRRDDAESRALRATLHERRGAIDQAIADWRAALAAAEHAGARHDALACRVELCRALCRRPGGRLEAAALAAEIADDAPLDPRGRAIVAAARLSVSGRYARARGLDVLVELAAGADSELARAAVRAACAHADASGRGLTAVELERVRRAAERWPGDDVRARLVSALEVLAPAIEADSAARSAAIVKGATLHAATRDHLERARAVLSGGAAGPRPLHDAASWCALAAIAALRTGQESTARARLRELRAAGIGPGHVAAWTAAWLALERPLLRDDALALAEALLATRGAPPRGFQQLAIRLERAGAEALALRALARAHEQRESGALEARSAALVRAGWRAWAAGRRDDAIARLAEARALARARA